MVHKLELHCPKLNYFCENLQAQMDNDKTLHSSWCLAMKKLSIPVPRLIAVICVCGVPKIK
jgi:hypothetical protein